MESLKSDTQLVIGMCETGVDITWQVGVRVQIQVHSYTCIVVGTSKAVLKIEQKGIVFLTTTLVILFPFSLPSY